MIDQRFWMLECKKSLKGLSVDVADEQDWRWRLLDVRHLLTDEHHVVVDIIKLIIKSLLHALKTLPHSLVCSPILASSNVLFITIKYRITLIAGVAHVRP